ncbi:VCBS domain-containing protein [Pseudomonas sp. LA21]|uniref:VCBS domain-containing protein n=1 Tax=Pseudomonas sp. LA21 TaxID=2893373 RepID=UPI001FB5EE8A|nr:VCBS domain-containing protein [Pseudomonas sp. LA21]MCJ1886426.1 VCBS domain-containing protein [Pseudomonas sp. LA21]
MDNQGKARAAFLLRPHTHALALEQRILFDGAAAAAVDQQHHDSQPTEAKDSTPPATAVEARAQAAAPAPGAPRNLVVIDARLENRDQLAANLPVGTTALVVDAGQDAIAAISNALAQLGKVDSIQVFSHGATGQFTLGSQTFTAQTVDQLGERLSAWRSELSPGADIQLYGCDTGAGSAGQTLVNELARWTGADVGASSNTTGSTAAGGDWNLEVRAGDLDKNIALSASTLDHFQGLLANASPTVSISIPSPDVLLGDQFTFNVDLRNTSSQVGFAPYIDLFLPATGKDGDDGIRFVSASYLGHAVKSYVVTFDAAGNATHPLAKDASGKALVITAASVGMKPGDQFVVLQVPYASVSQDQPVISLQVTATLSNLADTSLTTGSPDLTINARGGFEYGNDSLNNPTVDPSLVEASLHPLVIHPTLLDITQSINMTEGETATGPNFVHTQTVTVTPADGQTLHNVVVTQSVPADVRVTAITPGAGGTLTSVTLRNGTVLTNPALINAAIADPNIFVVSYSITYATLSAPTSSTVDFYVPEVGADGDPVIDPTTGNPVTIGFGAPTATGQWTPLDPRDVTPPATDVDFSATGDGTGAQFVAKSITLQKQALLQNDIGSTGLSPGDTLRYVLNVALSDYFAFGENLLREGQFTVTDTLADGQRIVGTPTMTISQNGVPQTIALVYSAVANADGTTTLTVDIGASILNAVNNLGLGALYGDLAFDDVQTAATTAVISYNAIINQAYTTSHPPHTEINEGDRLGNNATVSATVLEDAINIGALQSDGSSTLSTIPTSQVDINLLKVNGGNPPADGELRPGDVVTFQLSYNLVTGDYENFSLTAYLPLPLLNVSGIGWSVGNGVGQWSLGAGNSDPARAITVSSGAGNSVVFNFGNYTVNQTTGGRIELTFTLRVGDQPFADQRSLDVLAQSSQTTTIDKTVLVSSDVAVVQSIAEPVLNIKHGVVSSYNGTVTGTTGTWNKPGTSGVPFGGSVTDLAAIDGNITGIDGGDMLRLATAIENTGGGGAFDVVTSITLPPDLAFVGGSLAAANLQIYRGDGTLLRAGVDYSVSGSQITFLDANFTASLLPGRAGTTADTSGQNIVVITYDVVANNAIAAGRTLQSTAILSNYASVNNGTDFTPTDLTDIASQQVAAPEIRKVFAGGSLSDNDSSASHTTGNNLVVGESMLYDIVVTLPEGTTRNLSIDDLIPAGLRLDTSFNGGRGYQLILTAAGSGGSLSRDFLGSIVISGMSGVGGTLGADGVDARFAFSASTAGVDNEAGNSSFVIRVQLVVSNVIGNQATRSLQNDARLVYQDPDGDTPNGTTPLDRTVNRSGGAPTVIVREPTLQITQAITSTPGIGGYDQGDRVDFTVTISNGNGANDYAAFDINLLDILPTELDNITLTGVLYQGGATNNGGVDFVIQNGQLITANGANIDIAKGGSITLRLTGVVNATAAGQATFANNARVQWTSLDGTNASERTGADGVLNGGTLNDYRQISALLFPVSNGILISRVGGLPDTPPPSDGAGVTTSAINENVAVGELIRYRVVVLVPAGDNPNYQLRLELAAGLQFLPADLNNILIALVSDNPNGLTTDASLIKGGTLWMAGSEASPVAGYITPDLSGVNPTGIFDGNATHLNIVTNANGSQTVTFNLGNVINRETVDGNIEGIVLDFNVRVTNVASNQAGSTLGVKAIEHVGLPGQDVDRGTSNTLLEHVVEPSFDRVHKQVVDIQPGPSTTTATVSVDFTQNGGVPAYNVHLQDQFPSGSNYQVQSILLNGTALNLGSLPAGIRVSTGGALSVDFDRLAVGDKVQVIYRVTVPSAVVVDNAASSAVLTWTSLPTSFETGGWGGSVPGAAGTASGERTGQDGAAGLNNYVLSDGVGLGVVQGTLWNDTNSATGSITPDGPGFAGRAVQLTWAGADNSFGTADDRVFNTVTDANGQYKFAVLPTGNYLVVMPKSFQLAADNRFNVRIDTDTGTSASGLGSVALSLGEGAVRNADAGYVHLNEAPVNTLAGQHGREDTVLHLLGLAVADADAGSGILSVTLSVQHGVLWQTATAPGPNAVPPGGAGRSLTLTGTLAQLNVLLSQVYYKGDQDFNTFRNAETLTMTTNDQGNFGDANGDGIPGQNPADALTDVDQVQIIVDPVNDAPIARNDAADAVEAGGTNNQTPGSNPSFNALANDSDVDIATNNDVIRVATAGRQGGTQFLVPNGSFQAIAGGHGLLVIYSSGAVTYTVDNTDAAVQALRQFSDTLTDTFTYTITDLAGATSTATITITIHGANDAPVAVDDPDSAAEAGGVNNSSGGQDAVGNVLTNDTDVDQFGETKTVTGIRTLRERVPGPITDVVSGVPQVIVGTYGTLTINSDGSYRYVVDNTKTAVERLVPGDTLNEYFTYRVTDAGGLSDLAELRITISGNHDNPVASDDRAVAQAAATNDPTLESNPTGNVILFPSRPGSITQPGGNGVDTDVDRIDRPSSKLSVIGIGSMREDPSTPLAGVGAGTTSSNGTAISASYAEINGAVVTDPDPFGTLTIGADGSFRFDVNSDNATIQGLPAGQAVVVYYTYEIVDQEGLKDRAQLVITIRGVNDPPVAQIVVATAVEKGGIGNNTGGSDPSGDITLNATDPDGDLISVYSVNGQTFPVDPSRPLVVNGTYGTLTIFRDGTYRYALNNNDPTVDGLRLNTDHLFDGFTYVLADDNASVGLSEPSFVLIVIHGANDNPVATDDGAVSVEAGGVNNNQPGSDPSGNVLDNDSDVDAVDLGETKAVDSVRTGSEFATGTAGSLGVELRGTYGWLTLNADGSYHYRLDNSDPRVQALRSAADQLTDDFTYAVIDTAGAQDLATLRITIHGANDTPVAQNDNVIAIEKGGRDNNLPGFNPSGNVLANDSDVDAGDTLVVTGVRQGLNNGALGTAFVGTYGTLTLNADGTFSYVLDNDNPLVEALRNDNDRLEETFTYSIRDLAGATSVAQLTISIHGRNDAPHAPALAVFATEAGGTFNGTPGISPTGNSLTDVRDVDAYGETRLVNGIRNGDRSSNGTFNAVGNADTTLLGRYGVLHIRADGQFQYFINNRLPEVEALKPGESLVEFFSYQVVDADGASDIGVLRVTVLGAWDAPVAHDDLSLALAQTQNGGTGYNPSGNVLNNDTDVDAGDGKVVSGIRVGTEAAGGTLEAVTAGTSNADGTLIQGLYGQLIIGSDGSYTYNVDSNNPAVQALSLLETLVERFTYEVRDNGGLVDLAQLNIIVFGRNDAPHANPDAAEAIEAGGLHNATPGFNPSGNVVANDTDLEGDTLTVFDIRTGGDASGPANGVVGTPLRGLYGTLLMNADGSWSYEVDNSLPAVEALRLSGQTLTEVFTYGIHDKFNASDYARLTIVIRGANDTPIARDDAATAVEAGGVNNGTPGVDPSGNVLDNDSDVDSVANGETRQVVQFSAQNGRSANAGQSLQGLYGTLVINADGSYRYLVDNSNPTVQALRSAGETLTEVFTYRMRDTAGATSDARLTLTIQGANDNPVARDDSNFASDQVPAPHTSGNVLPNDSDVDGGDRLSVSGIRTGQENESGTAGTVGQPIAGRYGTLVLNADGSYTYTIDLSNPEVLAAAGLGQVLKDYFTYTVSDLAGATDQALLTITLDISTPYIPPGPYVGLFAEDGRPLDPVLGLEPAIFVQPVVERIDHNLSLSAWGADGSNINLFATPEIQSLSLGAQLGQIKGQFVARAVGESRRASDLDKRWVEGRHGVTSLSADGLLPDPSLWAPLPGDMVAKPDKTAQTARGFRAQLRDAAQRRSGNP